MTRLRKARRISPAEQRYLQAQLAFRRMTTPKPVAEEQLDTLQETLSILGAAIKSKLPDFKNIKTKVQEAQKKMAQQELKRKEALEVIKRQEEKRKAQAAKEAFRIEVERRDRQKLPSRNIDTRQLMAVRIDAKTVVYVKPGSDPDAVKRKFRERNKD